MVRRANTTTLRRERRTDAVSGAVSDTAATLLREAPGLLVYAGGAVALLTAGLLAANGLG